MDWTKIQVDLLQSRKTDKEILAITKYQLLWAMLERQPDERVALCYMTRKQLNLALDYVSTIAQQVDNDIKSVENHRGRQKKYYEKNQTLSKNTDGHTDGHTDALDKIREDIYRESNRDNKGGMGGKEGEKFTPPTETEVLAYAKQMNDLAGTGGFKCTEQQALLFHAYFERMKWKDKNGTPVYEWEKAFKYWVRRDEQNSYSKEQQDGIPDTPRYV